MAMEAKIHTEPLLPKMPNAQMLRAQSGPLAYSITNHRFFSSLTQN